MADLPAVDLKKVARALGKVKELEAATEKAREYEFSAVVELAELVGVKRRDRDTVIDAVVTAEQMIVDAAIIVANEDSDAKS